jgi:protein-disulfide isomerase
LAAESLYCAGEQGRFWEMHDWVFFHVDDWAYADDVVSTLVSSPTAELGLDAAAMETCLLEERYRGKLESILADAVNRGVGTTTPTFQINERPLLRGALPFEEFQRIIEEELAR